MPTRFIRIAYSVVVLLSVLFLPYWVTIILALAGMISFSFYIEAVILLFITDLLYGVREGRFFGIVFVSLIISIVLLAGSEFFKKKTRFA